MNNSTQRNEKYILTQPTAKTQQKQRFNLLPVNSSKADDDNESEKATHKILALLRLKYQNTMNEQKRI